MQRSIVTCALLFTACGSVTSTPPDAATAPDATEVDAPPPVPLISDALADTCGAYTPPGGVATGNDLHRVVLDDPDAICNDGTPAVMYVRPSVGAANANRWVFYLQGGGSCGTAADCAIRYCGTQKYTKTKMSSRWAPLAANTDGTGLLDRDGVNAFGDANLVLMYYCSSDGWMGQKSDTVLTDPDDPTLQYRLHFRGHTIIDAALEQLLAGPVTSEDGIATMPALSSATGVLWSGGSAGGNGAEQNLDFVADKLAPNGTEVRGVFDANMPPQVSDLGDPNAEAAFGGYDRDVQWPIYQDAYDVFVDQSCLTSHPADEQWECGENEHVVLNHIATPFFVRQDLADRTIGRRYIDAGATDAQLATAYTTTLDRVPGIAGTGEEGAAVTVTPGLYAPNCGQHIALGDDGWFEESTMTAAGGTEVTYRAALIAWLEGTPIDLVDTNPSTLSTCAAASDGGE